MPNCSITFGCIFNGRMNYDGASSVNCGPSLPIVPNTAYMESKYDISRRILQRTRAKLSRLGLIEHVSYLNSRYGGQSGWKLSSRFESALKQLAEKCMGFRDIKTSTREKDLMLMEFANARRKTAGPIPI